jgi:Phosphotransferase enzyme family
MMTDVDGDPEVLQGGVANAGAVVRIGGDVLRPSNPNTASVHRFLRSLAAAGFEGASVPVGVDADGRERLRYIEGDVPVPPYPAWSQTDEALASTAHLLRRCHEAARNFEPHPDDTWASDLADPEAADASTERLVICHNDVCLENVVFRDGIAVGLLDFDWAAPGRPAYDVACFARMCVPVDDDESAAANGFGLHALADRPGRLRLVTDSCGLDADGRTEVLTALDGSIAGGGRWVAAKVAAGEPGFVAMWEAMGGMARYDRRRAWWSGARPAFAAALA